MKILAFEFTKILASKLTDPKGELEVNTNIEFLSMNKEDSKNLKDNDIVKVDFKYAIKREPKEEKETKKKEVEPSILLEGTTIVSLEKGQGDELVKAWKEKLVSDKFKIPLFNFILRKCTPKAIALEDELNIPVHLPLPKIKIE